MDMIKYEPTNALDDNLMDQIAADTVVDQANAWLCDRRKEYHHNNDVWDVRWKWAQIKPKLQADLVAGRYRLSPTTIIHGSEETIELWTSLDALVLKAIAIVLARHLAPQLSDRCFHLAGNGGSKAAVRAVRTNLHKNTYVFRTDVKKYYASIHHEILFRQLQSCIADTRVLELLKGYVTRVIYDDGLYKDVKCGISLGCPLSPLMGALYLKPLDDLMSTSKLFYARFMDDWVILSPTRWTLRSVIRRVNQILAGLKIKQHPDKTFVGRIARGFDFLGYSFSASGLCGLTRKSCHNMLARVHQLYEQGADSVRIGDYLRHWCRWAMAGITTRMQLRGGGAKSDGGQVK